MKGYVAMMTTRWMLRVILCAVLANVVLAQGPVKPSGAGTAGNPYQISQLGHLVWMGNNVGTSSGTYYTVQSDIDASSTTNWNNGAGFAPIGTNSDIFAGTNAVPFMGIFDGAGKVIRHLTMFRTNQNYVGLFGLVGSGASVVNLGLEASRVAGNMHVGALAGYNYDGGTVSVCYATGLVSGGDRVGGLVGGNEGAMSVCHSMVTVAGSTNVGGLVGIDYTLGTMNMCYAEGSATGGQNVGGLVGGSSGWSVNDSYATCTVAGTNGVGGLVGGNIGYGISRCYAAGAVTGSTNVGGLAGYNSGSVNNSYWDTNHTGQANSAGGIGRTTAQMKMQATFVGWDFTNVWRIGENVSYPYLALPPRMAAPVMGTGPAVMLRWCSVTNYSYTVHYSTNLLSGFSVLQGGIPAKPPDNSYTDNVTGVNAKFWKVSAEH